MPFFVIAAALLSACISMPPNKVFELPGQKVFWVYMNFQLMRCYQHQIGAPVCMRAKQIPNPLDVARTEDAVELASPLQSQAPVIPRQPRPSSRAPLPSPPDPFEERDTPAKSYPEHPDYSGKP